MAPPKKTSTAYKDSSLHNIVAILKKQIPLLKKEFAESSHPLTDHAMKELDAIGEIIQTVEDFIKLFDGKKIPNELFLGALLTTKIPALISIIFSFDPNFKLHCLKQGGHVKNNWSTCFVLQGEQLFYIDKKKKVSKIAASDILVMPSLQNKVITKDTFTRHPAMEKLSIISQYAFLHNFPEDLQAFVPFLDLSFPIDKLSTVSSILSNVPGFPKKPNYTNKRIQDYVRDINEKMLKKTKNENDAQFFYSDIRQNFLAKVPTLDIDQLIHYFFDDHLKTYKITEASDSIDDLMNQKAELEAILPNLNSFNVPLETYLNNFYKETHIHLIKTTLGYLDSFVCPVLPEFSELRGVLEKILNVEEPDFKKVRETIRLLTDIAEDEGFSELFKTLTKMQREIPETFEPNDSFYLVWKNQELIYLSLEETHELYIEHFQNIKQTRALEIQAKIRVCDQQIAVFQAMARVRQTHQNLMASIPICDSLETIKVALQMLLEGMQNIQNDLNIVEENRGNTKPIREILQQLCDLKMSIEAEQKLLNDAKKKAAYDLLMTSVTSAGLEELIAGYGEELIPIQESLTDCQNRFTNERNILEQKCASLLLLIPCLEEALAKLEKNNDTTSLLEWSNIEKEVKDCENSIQHAGEELQKITREEAPLLKREAELNEKITELKNHQKVVSLIEELNNAITSFKEAKFNNIKAFRKENFRLIEKLGAIQLAFNALPPIKYDAELRINIQKMMNEAATCLQDEIRNRLTAICNTFNETAEELKQDSIVLNQVDYTGFSLPSTELARDLYFYREEMNLILDMIQALPPQYRSEQNIEETFEEALDAFKQSLLNFRIYVEGFHESTRNLISIFSNETKHQTRDFLELNTYLRIPAFEAPFELFSELNLSDDFYEAYQTLLDEVFPLNLATLQNELLTFSQEQKAQHVHFGQRIAEREEQISHFMNGVLNPYMERTRRERRFTDFISTRGADTRQTHVDDIRNILNDYKKSGNKENTLSFLNRKLTECATHPALSSIIRQAMLSVLDFEARVPTHYNLALSPEIAFDPLNNAYLYEKIETVPLRTLLKSLRDTTQLLRREGSLLTEKGKPEGAILTQLQQSLKLDLYVFLESFDENATDDIKRLAFKNFQEKFTLRLHSQDFALRQSVHFHSIFPLIGAIKKAFAKLCNYFEFEYFNALSTRASRYRVFQAKHEIIGNILGRLEDSFPELVVAPQAEI